MPIPRDKRHLYGEQWQEIRARILRRATPEGETDPHCENCGKRDRSQVVTSWGGDGEWAYLEEENDPTAWRDRSGEWTYMPGRKLRITLVVLTVAHLNHAAEDHRDENLKALCQACHLWHDMAHHQRNRKETLLYPKQQLRLLEVERKAA